jgi:hypothetical protein
MKTTIVFAAAALAAAGITLASPAAADTSNCQTIGSSTFCGQGVGGGDSSGGGGAPNAPGAGGPNTGGGCTNAYGAYQNCNAH